MSKGGGATYEMVKQVTTMVAVMKSAPEAPGTATPKTKSKTPELTRQIILCKWYVTSVITIIRVNAVLTDDREQRTDPDIHADMCFIGQHVLILHNFNYPVNVVGYDLSKGIMTLDCWTVSEAVAYDCPMTGEFFIIEAHQAILIDHLHNNILFPLHIRMYDVKVNDIPKYLTENPTDQTHSIFMFEKGETLLIPLHLHGVTSYFTSRKSTMEEYNNCMHFSAT